MQLKIGKKYRHYKGQCYKVLCVGKHAETDEDLVVYEALYGDHQIWIRPIEIFMSDVVHEGKQHPRFREEE